MCVCVHESEIMIPFLPFLNPYLLSAYRLSCMHIIHLVLLQFHHQSQQKRIEVAKGDFMKTNAHSEITFIFALSIAPSTMQWNIANIIIKLA